MKKQIKEIIEMVYQFVFAGALFWILSCGESTPLIGNVIASFENINIDWGGVFIIVFMVFGTTVMCIRRIIKNKNENNN